MLIPCVVWSLTLNCIRELHELTSNRCWAICELNERLTLQPDVTLKLGRLRQQSYRLYILKNSGHILVVPDQKIALQELELSNRQEAAMTRFRMLLSHPWFEESEVQVLQNDL